MAEFIALQFNFASKNLDAFFKNSDTTKVLNDSIKLAALEIRNNVVKKISKGARSGRVYKRRSISHQAAGAGEPPKTDTGRLVGSVRTDFGFLTADIGSDIVYAIFQEKGTSKMAAHPYLQPSLEETEPKIGDIFNNALRRIFKL